MLRGPIDFVVLGFNSSSFDGSVLRELEAAVASGVISVIDLGVVSKNKDGLVTRLNISNLNDDNMTMFMEKYHLSSSDTKLDQDDVDEVGELLENDTTAAILIIEHLWAKPLKQALINKKGYLIAEGRIHPEESAKLEKGE